MKYLFRISVLAACIYILLSITSGVLIRRIFPKEKIKLLFLNELTASTDREVRIEKLSLGLFSGIRINGFELSDRPSFSNGVFIKSTELRINYSLIALLKKRLVITSVELRDPVINISTLPGSETNIADLLSYFKGEKPELPPSATSDFSFFVKRVRTINGTLTLHNETLRNDTMKLSILNMDIRGISFMRPFYIKCNTAWTWSGIEGTLESHGIMNIHKKILKIKDAIVSSNKSSIKITGTVGNPLEKPEYKMSVIQQNLNAKNLINIFENRIQFSERLMLSGPIQLDIKLSGSNERITTKGNIKLDETAILFKTIFQKAPGYPITINIDASIEPGKKINLHLAKMDLKNSNLKINGSIDNLIKDPALDMVVFIKKMDINDIFELVPLFSMNNISGEGDGKINIKGPLQNVKTQGRLNLKRIQANYSDIDYENMSLELLFTEETLKVTGLSGKVSGFPFNASFSLVDFKKPQIDFSLNMDALDLKPFLTKRSPEKGPGSQKIPEENPEQKSHHLDPAALIGYLKDTRMNGNIHIKKMFFNNLIIEDPYAIMKLSNRIVHISPLSLRTCEGNLRGVITCNLKSSDQPWFRISGTAEGIKINSILSNTTKYKDIINGKLRISFDLIGKGPRIDHLTGEIEGSLADTTMTGLPLITSLSSVIENDDLQNIRYDNVSGSFKIADGRASTEELRFISDDVNIYASGWIDIRKRLNFDVKVSIPEKPVSGSQEEISGEDKPSSSKFLLTGSFDSPSFKPTNRQP